jgi:hypothetical protein
MFILCNVTKLAPWEWDNIKILIYWFVASVPLVAWLLGEFTRLGKLFRVVVAGITLVLILSGGLDIWRVISGAIDYKVFNADGVKIAEDIRVKTPPNAVFLNAPTYNTPVVLSGRRSVMRYSAHLMSHGIDYLERESDLKRIYAGDATAEMLMKKYNVDYVLVGSEEHAIETLNKEYFKKFQLIAQQGEYKVYKVR